MIVNFPTPLYQLYETEWTRSPDFSLISLAVTRAGPNVMAQLATRKPDPTTTSTSVATMAIRQPCLLPRRGF